MYYDTFNIVSVIYHICAISNGAQEAHVFCGIKHETPECTDYSTGVVND
jgi:predicted ArsR family transcriptional regulator